MRGLLLLLLLLEACSKGASADVQYIGAARSAAGEWALVNEQTAQGKLTGAYVDTMHKELRRELQRSLAGLSEPGSSYGEEIRALLREPDDGTPEQLRTHAARLKQIEDRLESA
jgi:hypothetical protein